MSSLRAGLLVVTLLGCGPAAPVARLLSDRRPFSTGCDAQDVTRCLLPWPNRAFTVADERTPTGVRVSVERRTLPNPDDPAPLNALDGFSTVSPLAVGFPGPISVRTDARPATAMRLFHVSGDEVSLRLSVTSDGPGQASLLVGYPLWPMRPGADYVAVVLDEVEGSGAAPRQVKLSLGLEPPVDDAERAFVAHQAPVRAVLKERGVEAARVRRVWEFTTRSSERLRRPLESMRLQAIEVARTGGLTVSVAMARALPFDALEVRGSIDGLPRFTKPTGELVLDESGGPLRVGTHSTPFRIVLPRATRPWRLVVYGHGTGGSVYEDTFDRDIVGVGAAKLSLRYDGWTETTAVETLVGLDRRFTGSERSTGRLLQSLADASAIEASLDFALGEVLARPTLDGVVNPAAGVRHAADQHLYAGGSLGGTLGFVHTLTEPTLKAGVLNVPGAGWTHFVVTSSPFSTLDALFATTTPSAIDRALSVVMTQGSWDPVDGAAWAAMEVRPEVVLLIQQSMGDPVLPNVGTHLVATSMKAAQVAEVLEPVERVERVTEAQGRSALTQFRIPNRFTGDLDRHGFGGKDTPAGVAAREQIVAFLESVWSGAPRIVVPPTCRRGGLESCDFGVVP